MTNLEIIRVLTTVWLVENCEMFADEEKEGVIFLTLTSQGLTEDDVNDLIEIHREGNAEELLRSLGLDDDYFVGALAGFKMTFNK